MKPEELMLGDIVTFEDCQNDKEPVIIKIWSINQDGEAFAFIDDDESVDEIVIDDEIVGIPLTQEILEKNGFENITSRLESSEQYIHLYEINDDIVIGELPSGFNICIERYNGDYDVYEHFSFCSICNIHELQHALKLCGIDKTIEL